MTFQEPPVVSEANKASGNPSLATTSKPPSTDLLDNLFSSSIGGSGSGSAGGRRRQPATTDITALPQRQAGRRTTDFLDENPTPKPESVPK